MYLLVSFTALVFSEQFPFVGPWFFYTRRLFQAQWRKNLCICFGEIFVYEYTSAFKKFRSFHDVYFGLPSHKFNNDWPVFWYACIFLACVTHQ